MCPSPPVSSLAPIELHSSDQELVGHLERMVRGAPLPPNVFTDMNPYDVLPWNLPEHIWCFINLEDPKATGTGYWKATGEGCTIPKNAFITGCRTTLEFYNGTAPYGTKTDWMMYEYKLNRKGPSERNEVSRSLCRVFLNSIQSPNREEHQNLIGAYDANRDGSSRSQVNYALDQNGLTAVSERYLPDRRPRNPVQDLHENYDISGGDFLELLDLDNPQSPSSSSENSSCLTMSSDECFDSLSLLREIEAGKSENTQTNQKNSNLYVSTSHRPKQMVLKPTSSGSAVQQHVLKSKMQKHVAVQGPSTNSANKVASSSGLPADSDGKGKTVGRMTKFMKKFCCFIPF